MQKEYTSALVKSLLWHYLYQLEVDSAFKKCDSLALHLMATYPQISESAWLRGVHLVKGSKIIEGFRILDSLRINGSISNTGFLTDFKELSSLCFLPPRFEGIDSVLFLGSGKRSGWRPVLEDSEMVAQKNNWRVLEHKSGKREFPLLVFDGEYILKPHVLLRYFKIDSLRLVLNIREEFYQKVWYPLLFDFQKTPSAARMEVVADASGKKQSIQDYLYFLIGNRYDAVRVVTDIKPLYGISVRCYKRSIYRELPGAYDAFAVFDLRVNRRRPDLFYCKGNSGDGFIDVRYLVSMKSSTEVEDKAELIFQKMIDQFRNWRTLQLN